MMTNQQKKDIRNYLLSKNLPIDLLMEVEDHFTMQIGEFIRSENIDFNHAFYQVKVLWEKELTFPRYNIQFYLYDVTPFVRKINRNILKETLKKTLYYSLIISIFYFGGIFFFNENFYGKISFLVLLLIFLAPLFVYIFRCRDFQLVKKYDHYVLTYYQNFILVFAGGAGAFAQILFRYNEVVPTLYEMFAKTFGWEGFWVAFGCFSMIVWSVFNVICQRKYLNQIEKVKSYLHFLRPS